MGTAFCLLREALGNAISPGQAGPDALPLPLACLLQVAWQTLSEPAGGYHTGNSPAPATACAAALLTTERCILVDSRLRVSGPTKQHLQALLAHAAVLACCLSMLALLLVLFSLSAPLRLS